MGERDAIYWKSRLVGFDFEVTSYDWLLVIRKYPNNEVLGIFHNDNQGVIDFIDSHDYIYVGYNCKHYDNYILKGILNNYSPQEIKEINDWIIVEHKNGWEYPFDMPFVKLPPTSDLKLDMPKRQSLKEVEGNMYMNIQESTVDFNIDHSWTKEEFDEMLFYCKHDVKSTVKLTQERGNYLESKVSLGELCELSPEGALYKTNAQLSAFALGAEKQQWDDYRDYEYPKEVNLNLIPQDIQDFVERFKTIKEDELNEDNVKLRWQGDIAGVPHVIGLGGIHGAIKNYKEESNNDRLIVNYDVASYYPTLLIKYGYLSRNVKDPSIYENYYHARLEAKAKGDKKKANGLKLVLNTTYGASLNKYNDLYDPLMGVSTCLTGQLLLTQLIITLTHRVSEFRLIQSNTDGIMFSLPRFELDCARDVIKKWSNETKLEMEEEQIDRVIQKDVNNYIIQKSNGDIKNVGGYVTNYPHGTFDSNSLSIIHKAIVEYFINDTPLEETINACNDPFQFQLIAKTGSTYQKTLHYVNGEEIEVQKVNRLYATKDESLGVVKKYKKTYLELDEDGERRYYINLIGNKTFKKSWETDEQGDFFITKTTVQNCPPHAIIDNSCQIDMNSIDTIDKSWYIEVAKKRINDFLGIKEKNKKEKKEMATKKEEVQVVEPRVALLKKIYKVGEVLAKYPWVMDGYNSHQSYEYVSSDKYRENLGKACREVGLLFKMNIGNRSFEKLEGKMNLTTIVGSMCFIDPDTGEHEDYMVMGDGTDNLDKGIYKAETLMIKYFVLNNFLLPKQQDEIDPENGVDDKKAAKEEKKSPINIKGDSKPKSTHATPKQREEAKEEVVANNDATKEFISNMIEIMDKIREVKEGYGEKTYQNLLKCLDGTMSLTKTDAVSKMTKLEEKMDELGID